MDRMTYEFGSGNGGDTVNPGAVPNEVEPQPGDNDRPAQTPAEVQPDEGDVDRPGSTPAEAPPQPSGILSSLPMETD